MTWEKENACIKGVCVTNHPGRRPQPVSGGVSSGQTPFDNHPERTHHVPHGEKVVRQHPKEIRKENVQQEILEKEKK
jgi:hypothetical protein